MHIAHVAVLLLISSRLRFLSDHLTYSMLSIEYVRISEMG